MNVFGGFRRSAAMTIGTGGQPFSFLVVVAAVVAVVAVLTEAKGGKQRVGCRRCGLYPVYARTRCQPLLQIRNM